MALTRITVLGTGVLGSQIAYQTAFSGLEVVAWDIDEAALEKARTTFAGLAATYSAGKVAGAENGGADAALSRLTLVTDLAAATAEADLVIEAVPESIDIKRDLYARLASVAPERTVFATNSSTLLPSALAESTGRPDRFLALHFANRIWLSNTAEVMGTTETSPEVYAEVVEFAKSIGMVPIELKKEKAGYVLNSLLVPLLNAASDLYIGDYASPETIDVTWRIGTGSPLGPFQIMDIVGLTTVYNISMAGNSVSRAFAARIKEEYMDKGRLGVATGAGFYDYPPRPMA